MKRGLVPTAWLVERKSGRAGLSIEQEGVCLCSAIDLVWREGEDFRALDCEQVGVLLRKGFDDDRDPGVIAGVLATIATSLAKGDLAHARILGLFLPFATLGRNEHLAKTYNPDEPRVPAGRGRQSGEWTSGVGQGSAPSPPDHTLRGGRSPIPDHRHPDESGSNTSGAQGLPDAQPGLSLPVANGQTQVEINRATHEVEVAKEIAQWRAKGLIVTPNVTFKDPTSGIPVVADYVVSLYVANPNTFFLTMRLEPILVRDVKTGDGGPTDNQRVVYPKIIAGGAVIPVGANAEAAGFTPGVPTVIKELYVGGGPFDFTVH
jgi:hypothetical protein